MSDLIREAAALLRQGGHPLHAAAVEGIAQRIAELNGEVDRLMDLAAGVAADTLELISRTESNGSTP